MGRACDGRRVKNQRPRLQGLQRNGVRGDGRWGQALVRVREMRVCRWFVNEDGAPEHGGRGAGKTAEEKGCVGRRQNSPVNGQAPQS